MTRFARTAIAVTAFLACAASHAETFYYSYTFHTGHAITGSFDGTANGNLVTGLSNISVEFDGESLISGPVTDYGYTRATNKWTAGTAVLSFDGTANNFAFAGSQFGIGHMFFIGDDEARGVSSAVIFASTGVTVDEDSPGVIQSRWTLTREPIPPAVPEPETYAMLLAGLGLVGFAARHKRATK